MGSGTGWPWWSTSWPGPPGWWTAFQCRLGSEALDEQAGLYSPTDGDPDPYETF